MPIIASMANSSVKAYGWSTNESLDGIVLMMPTSIASTGTGNSSSIGGNGSVTFSSCATLSLNGVFTADYDNYMIVTRSVHSALSDVAIYGRLRVNSVDATGSNYTTQYLDASSTSVTCSRSSSVTDFRAGATSNTLRNGDVLYLYGPYLAQQTAMRHITAYSALNARLLDAASSHSLSSSYDGLTLFVASGSISGLVSVYGLEN